MTPTPASPPEAEAPEIIIITGIAGAGRETAAHALEDIGWYVVYNIAPQLIRRLYDLQASTSGRDTRFAVVTDPRSGPFFGELPEIIRQLKKQELDVRLVFLDASEDVLVRRFDSVRRPHPLQGEEGVIEGLRREADQLEPLRRMADVVIDTSNLNVHQLAIRMRETFGTNEDRTVTVNLLSFGFKYGVPIEADHMADVRFLPNPYWVPELREKRGVDKEVSDFVLNAPNAREFVDKYVDALLPVLRGYSEENKQFATVAIGCTGGKHRSVAVSEEVAAQLRRLGHSVRVRHRDLGRE
ncbi:RNase adapter RapZ [Helcobacillus massiliensis]|uniref:UPF0042 nucleotide-binding protein n=1 Tax=Helcobacillus massiliensis TaxID=521392 RepID=A0A839QQS5_9MICO|nr:RNase adapter RapZ [Helcobacillus massiliensis]MCG7426994.1 RNase adapter RapZ [Helcobacillus sp. ACRRO]MBB3022362.1 UPF0042 nucleotide-binding protein [Helcobacillus massiliensis]MCT1557000.1 RNase adapter RapZ [Helcobacillus massiliensis]MCT2035389.1 RNase adapter RapZ [Helcobacillus massiliensis]MCT2331396.1 RNase adapter RapZ [Helcobacillus massiliensis]